MRKILMLVSILVLTLIMFENLVFANSIVIEKPKMNIVINSKVKTYENVPIIVNGRTLLPLRFILNDLGIKDESIFWNAKERSVTVNEKDKTVYLIIDKLEVFVNKKKTVIDVAPIIYKDRTYIPVRFMSETFEKEVAWDSSSESVFICDEDKYNEVLSLINSTVDNMSKLGKVVKKDKSVTKIKINNKYYNYKKNVRSMIDLDNKEIYSYWYRESPPEFGVEKSILEIYYKGKYMHVFKDNKWQKQTLSENEIEKMFSFNEVDLTKVVGCGFSLSESTDKELRLLSGNVNLDNYVSEILFEEGIVDYRIYNVESKIYIEKNENHVKSIEIKLDGICEVDGVKYEFILDASSEFFDLNGDFEIEKPEGLS